jgi:hypothetical protein
MLNSIQIGIHHSHGLAEPESSLGCALFHSQGSWYQPCLASAPSQNHASWTLSSRSYSPSLDRASSQTSSLRHLVSSKVIKNVQYDLQETFDDENENEGQKRITLPWHNAGVIMSSVAYEDRTCSQPHERIRPRLFPCGEAQGATLIRCYHKSAVCLSASYFNSWVRTFIDLSYTLGSDILCRLSESKHQRPRKECLRLLFSSPLPLPQIDATSHLPMALVHPVRAERRRSNMGVRDHLKPHSGAAPRPGSWPPSPVHEYTDLLPSNSHPLQSSPRVHTSSLLLDVPTGSTQRSRSQAWLTIWTPLPVFGCFSRLYLLSERVYSTA